MQFVYFYLLVAFSLVHTVRCEYFSSVASLAELLELEDKFVEYAEEYLAKEKEAITTLEKFLNETEKILDEIEENPVDYYENPLNGIKSINRMVNNWEYIKERILQSNAISELGSPSDLETELQIQLPTLEDLQGAARGIVRLQKTYNIKTEDLANGMLSGVKVGEPMTAADRFELGRSLYEVKDGRYASDWLLHAKIELQRELSRSSNTYEFPYTTDKQILEYLVPMLHNTGNIKLAMKFNEELLYWDPTNEYALKNEPLFKSLIMKQRRGMEDPKTPNDFIEESFHTESEIKNVEDAKKVCNLEVTQTPAEQRDLRCRYVTKNVPFCIIAPFKMEELSHDPLVALYHETIYDKEIEKIVKEATGKLEPSLTGLIKDSEITDIRTSKHAWLWFHDYKSLNNLEQRLVDITGLNTATAGALQVANYGVGGHYRPHYDCYKYENPYTNDDSLATALFYISDVELGGATSFPFLHFTVPPIKGALLVWYNLHESLEVDFRSLHGGCPVLKGSKWIFTVWLNERGQEFTKPCPLARAGYKSIMFKPV